MENTEEYELDFMVVSAHADDAELGMGGVLAKMCSAGRRGVLVDLTRADAATRGSVEDRLREAEAARKILGVEKRINLGLQDAHITADQDSEEKLIRLIRKFRPRVLFVQGEADLHPDHVVAGSLALSAWYKAGLRALFPDLSACRPRRVFHYLGAKWIEPDFCVDISDHFETKMEAVLAYKSQFHGKNSADFEGKSSISTPEFLDFVRTRNRFLGTRIKAGFAEGFCCAEIPEVSDPCALSDRVF